MLNTENFRTVADLDKAYSEHRESLKVSGLPYDDKGLVSAWAEAVANLEADLARPRFDSLS